MTITKLFGAAIFIMIVAFPGTTPGFTLQPSGEDDPTAQKVSPGGPTPGSEKGIIDDDKLPAPGDSPAIDKALLGESLGASGAGLPTPGQGGVALPGGNLMQQLGDDAQRPAGVGGESKALLPAVQSLPSTGVLSAPTAVQGLQTVPTTQGIQGQKVAPATKTQKVRQ